MHNQDSKVCQAGSNVGTFRTIIPPPYSAQTLKHRGNILLQKLPYNFTTSLPRRYKSLQSLPWEPKISDLQMTQRKLKKWPQCTQFLTVFKRLGFLKEIYCTDSMYGVNNDKLENCSCKQFQYLHYSTSGTE